MTRFLLDTNALADCIFRRRGVDVRVTEVRQAGAKIGIAMPVMAELLAGIESSETRDKNLDIFNRNLRLFPLWPFTEQAARIYAQKFAELRQRGRTVAAMDLMIAATALALGNCTVVTTDSDMSAIPGLNVVNWQSQAKHG
jgi:tRNA(fMet)-specific endonuclease VapC